MEDEEATEVVQIFHNTVRENIIFLLLFLTLLLPSWLLVRRYRKRDLPREEPPLLDDDEATVYRISLWLCTVSLAVAAGAVLLLPISIVSNEVLLNYPNSYYVQWLNSSLIQGLWNHIFLFSNMSLFVLLPFAYLFSESEGFAGYKKGILSRIYETFTVLVLLAVVVLGMAYILSALLDRDGSSLHRLIHLWSYLPFIYSCVSFIGVLLLLVCTPMGLVRLFSVAGQFLVKPQFLSDLHEEYFVAKLEEECLSRQLAAHSNPHASSPAVSPNTSLTTPNTSANLSSASVSRSPDLTNLSVASSLSNNASLSSSILPPAQNDPNTGLKNGALTASLTQRLQVARAKTRLLERQRKGSALQRNLLYPLLMVLLVILSIITLAMVGQNAMQLLVGIKELPLSTKQVTLGEAPLSKMGLFGAVLEIVLIVYLVVTSAVGLFTMPGMCRLHPQPGATPLSHIIVHCSVLLLLSSALPLLSRILGITNLDLLGEFGQIEWLGSLMIVLSYNMLFVISVSACILLKFDASVRQELVTSLKRCACSLVGKETNCLTWPNSPLQAVSSIATTSSINKKDF
ncbi:hypothetical protein B566_EDAN006762 [Ephemera danica]|nr:hypothetical protein B566_EDAN006762 [Ephemera danica]